MQQGKRLSSRSPVPTGRPRPRVCAQRLDELFAGTSSLAVVKLLLSVAPEADLPLMILAVKRAFLYRSMRRSVYIELLRQDLLMAMVCGSLRRRCVAPEVLLRSGPSLYM